MTARLDQLLAEADAILTEPVFADLHVQAEELREMLVEMENTASKHLEQDSR